MNNRICINGKCYPLPSGTGNLEIEALGLTVGYVDNKVINVQVKMNPSARNFGDDVEGAVKFITEQASYKEGWFPQGGIPYVVVNESCIVSVKALYDVLTKLKSSRGWCTWVVSADRVEPDAPRFYLIPISMWPDSEAVPAVQLEAI